MNRRYEIVIALLALLLVLSSMLFDPALSVGLIVVLVLAYVIMRQMNRSDEWQRQ